MQKTEELMTIEEICENFPELVGKIVDKKLTEKLNELNSFSISRRDFCRRARISYWKLKNKIQSGQIIPDENGKIPVKYLNYI